VKPPAFRYHDPRTLDEMIALLGAYGDDSKVLAGGQSLVQLLNLRLARPAVIVDVNRVAGLRDITEAPDGGLRIGALVRHRELARSHIRTGTRRPRTGATWWTCSSAPPWPPPSTGRAWR
jgi:carbon-monoxide dehydrogenase medium subunit